MRRTVLPGGLPVVTVPTAASNDSPTSRIFVMYREDGALDRVEKLPRNPEAVIVDTELLLRAPPALLRSGIEELLSAAAAGDLRAVIGGVFPLSDVRSAHEELAARRTTGKLLLDPSG